MKPTSLQEIATKAKHDKTHRFRNLFGLITVGHLYWSWNFINRKASAGVDRISAIDYEADLIGNIRNVIDQVKEKRYRSKLVLRKYIPKGEGKYRPLGIPAIADKLLQTAVTKILEAIYEQDFLSCSYGYRPRTGAHQAIKSLTHALNTKRLNYVVEADIRSFFTQIDHDKLLEMIAQRIDDKAFLNLINKWLKAGILDKGRVYHPESGTPQGGTISPILANIYLHNVLDVWFNDTVQKHCKGQIHLCRYADDFVCAFEKRKDAERFYKALRKRLGKFNLSVAEEKTNILVFSRYRLKESQRFNFLGFEFSQELTRRRKQQRRRVTVQHRTSRKKMRASLANVRNWLRHNCGLPKKILFKKLNQKLRGYYHYYGLRGNYKRLSTFYYYITQALHKWLNRRSQRRSYNWHGLKELIKYVGLQKPRICHAF